MKKFATLALSTGLVMAMMVPAFADEETVSVTVNVCSSSAVEAGLDVPSVELDNYTVTVPAGTTAVDALKKALDDNGITYDIQASDYGTYIAGIGGLAGYSNPSATPDYSGWMLEYNGDGFTNWGVDYLGTNGDGIIGDGDKINLDYSLYMGADLGTNSSPYLTTLAIGGKVFTFTKEFKGYDETTYAPIFDYLVDGEAISGSGTVEDPFTAELDLGAVEEASFYPEAETGSHFKVVDLVDGIDFSKALEFSVESAYGQKSYFALTGKYTIAKADDNKADDSGDVNAMPLALVMISAMAAMVVFKKKEA